MLEWIGNNASFLFVVLVLAIIIILLGINFINRRKKTNFARDVRKDLKPNNTNYNMATFSRDELEGMSNIELKVLLEKCDEGELTSLSPRDFQYIKKRLSK